jgi:ketosteroid isomerase-like protein
MAVGRITTFYLNGNPDTANAYNMTRKFFIFTILFLLMLHTAMAQSNKQREATIIRSSRDSSNASIARHDIDGMAKFWLPDFVLVRGNSVITSGKENNINSWTELFKTSPEVSYIRRPSEIIISDNDTLAWEKGTWTAIKSYSKGGLYSAMWKKMSNEWKLQAELFVSLH